MIKIIKLIVCLMVLQTFVVCEGWSVQVIAEINGWGLGGDFIVDDTANYLGVNPMATDGDDGDFDIPDSPPPPGNYIRFYFPHFDWGDTFENEFTQDIRYENESLLNGVGIEWESELYSNMDGESSLIFIIEDGVPDCQVNIILDDDTFDITNGDTLFTYINAFQEKSVLININTCNYGENKINNQLISPINAFDAFPNPFNNVVVFEYTLSKPGLITIQTFDISGRRLLNGLDYKAFKPSGVYSFRWNAKNFNSGIYFLRVNVNNKSYSKKLTLLK